MYSFEQNKHILSSGATAEKKKVPFNAFFLSVEVNSPQSPVCERTDYENVRLFEIRK